MYPASRANFPRPRGKQTLRYSCFVAIEHALQLLSYNIVGSHFNNRLTVQKEPRTSNSCPNSWTKQNTNTAEYIFREGEENWSARRVAQMWNSLPFNIKTLESLSRLKNKMFFMEKLLIMIIIIIIMTLLQHFHKKWLFKITPDNMVI